MKKFFVMLMLIGMISAAQATIINDFESYDEGSDPGSMGNGVTVVTDTGTNGTKVLKQTNTAGNGWVGSGIKFDTSIVNDNTTIQFDAYFEASYNGVVGVSQWTGVDYVNFGDFQAMVRHDGGDGTGIDYRNGGSYIKIDSSIADVEQWHTYAFVVNYTDQNYDLYIDNNLVVSDAGFRATGHTNSSSFRILSGDVSAESSVMVDNVTVVPEPATFALLGLGGMLLKRKR